MTMDYGAASGLTPELLALLVQQFPDLATQFPLINLAYGQATGYVNGQPTIQQQQLGAQQNQFAQTSAYNQQALSQQAALAREQLAQALGISNAEMGLQRELGMGGLDLQRQGLGLQRELGFGNLDVSRARLALEELLGKGGLELGTKQFGLSRELGRGQLALGQKELSENTRLRERDQTLTGQNMLAQRATRQLAAPGGGVLPSLQPILGRSRI